MSANERGLGRGLDALFRNVTPAERPSSAKTDSAEVPAPSVPKNCLLYTSDAADE